MEKIKFSFEPWRSTEAVLEFGSVKQTHIKSKPCKWYSFSPPESSKSQFTQWSRDFFFWQRKWHLQAILHKSRDNKILTVCKYWSSSWSRCYISLWNKTWFMNVQNTLIVCLKPLSPISQHGRDMDPQVPTHFADINLHLSRCLPIFLNSIWVPLSLWQVGFTFTGPCGEIKGKLLIWKWGHVGRE